MSELITEAQRIPVYIVVLMVKLLIGGTDNSSVMATINYTEDL